jgi:diadenylate cyclase
VVILEGILEIFLNIGIRDIMDMAIVAFVFYKLLMLIRNTSAEQLIKGILVLLIATKLSDWMGFYVTNWILKNTMTVGVIALLIVFQPELRRALEHIGRSKLFLNSIMELDTEQIEKYSDSIVDAVFNLGKDKIGALIVMEGETGLSDVIETGTIINGEISTELLINIFIPNTPLHDGAVIIRNGKIMAAGCVLPLTSNPNISKKLGTRHRAGIGVTEKSDALTIMVSEETGAISVSREGKLTRFVDERLLRKIIKNAYEQEERQPLLRMIWRRKNDKDKK